MIVAVSMVKDEADIIEPVLRHLLAEGVDHLIVADNLSTDGTRSILGKVKAETGQLDIVTDEEPGYYQSAKMSRLARFAFHYGADWVLPFDADEVWYSPNGTIADALAQVPEEATIVRAPGWDHIAQDFLKVDEGGRVEGYFAASPFSPFRRQQTQQMVKVAFRAHPSAVLHMGNHDVERPGKSTVGPLAFRHFQYRSLEQMTRKLRNGRAAYEASDIDPRHGTHWREGGLLSDEEMARKWAELCSEEGLVFDPAPIRVTV